MTCTSTDAPQLNPVQQAVVDRGFLTSGFNCVLQMPTGAGKTWLAEQAILATLRSGARAIYLTPLRALANELLDRWRQQFADFEVGLFTGEFGPRRTFPVPFERAHLLIMTPERLDACTRHWRSHWSWLPEVGLLVVDELHLLGETDRGPRLEGALMRTRRLNPFLQLLGLSATLGNRIELAEWLSGVQFGSDWCPIPIEWKCLRYRRAEDKPSILREVIARCLADGGQSIVFVQSRRRAEVLSRALRDAGIQAGHHHAGLDSDDRRRLESEYRSGVIRVLVSTGTLEMGLNLPARQVVLYDLQKFDGSDFVPLSVNTVWQRAGRAGRRGLDSRGEVVLLAPTWDRLVSRYADGQFERIQSGLDDGRALAEQILAEVSSGLARTKNQLRRNLHESLAAHQQRLPNIDLALGEMLDNGMLVEIADNVARGPVLRATRLGRIAVRQMLKPSTVVVLAQALRNDAANSLTFFDLLLLCAQTNDCEPLIPADFEELEELGARLSQERSNLLAGTHTEVLKRFEVQGRRLLAVIKTALIARTWTRKGHADTVADDFGCYAFEVRRLSESLERILIAAGAVITPPKTLCDENTRASSPAGHFDVEPSTKERVRALAAMVAYGVDEETVTLTLLAGIGGTLARRLRDAGINDVEDLALAELDDLASIRGISRNRAGLWIELATEVIRTRPASFLCERGATTQAQSGAWPSQVEPYRLRRALDLRVRRQGSGFVVTGGLEPHRVWISGNRFTCDCADYGNGQLCKHVLAVRLYRKDPDLAPLLEQITSETNQNQLDLFKLWFEGGRT